MVGPWSCILLDEFHRHVFEVRGISPYRQWCTTDLARSLASSCFFGTAWHGHAMVFGSRHCSQKAQTQTTTYFSLQFHKPRQCGKEAHRFQWHFLGHHHDRETVELSAKEVLVRWGAFTVASVFLQVAGFGFGSNLFKWPSGLWLSRGGGMIWESVSVSHVVTCHVKVLIWLSAFRLGNDVSGPGALHMPGLWHQQAGPHWLWLQPAQQDHWQLEMVRARGSLFWRVSYKRLTWLTDWPFRNMGDFNNVPMLSDVMFGFLAFCSVLGSGHCGAANKYWASSVVTKVICKDWWGGMALVRFWVLVKKSAFLQFLALFWDLVFSSLPILGDAWAAPVAGAIFLMFVLAILPLGKDNQPFLGVEPLNLSPATLSDSPEPEPPSSTSRGFCFGDSLDRRPALKRSRASDFEDEDEGDALTQRCLDRADTDTVWWDTPESPWEMLEWITDRLKGHDLTKAPATCHLSVDVSSWVLVKTRHC